VQGSGRGSGRAGEWWWWWNRTASATATAATGAASEGTGCTGCWRAGGLGADHDHGARQHRRRRRRARRSMDQTRQGVCRRSQREGGITTHGAVQSSRWRLAACGRATDAMGARGSRKEQGIRRRIRRQTQMQRDGGLQTTYKDTRYGLLVGSLDLPARSPALPRLLQAAATGGVQCSLSVILEASSERVTAPTSRGERMRARARATR
jgi:hypothetical protein